MLYSWNIHCWICMLVVTQMTLLQSLCQDLRKKQDVHCQHCVNNIGHMTFHHNYCVRHTTIRVCWFCVAAEFNCSSNECIARWGALVWLLIVKFIYRFIYIAICLSFIMQMPHLNWFFKSGSSCIYKLQSTCVAL